MNVFFDFEKPSRAIGRVTTALAAYLPSGVQVSDRAQADLIVLHVIGKRDHMLQQARAILDQGKQYAVIQYALKSTRNPDPADWLPLWQGARVVWSYYELQGDFNFYCAPLAADPALFYGQDCSRDYLVGTLGGEESYRIECVGEVRMAAFEAGGRVIHAGPRIGSDPIVEYVEHGDDDVLRDIYNRCLYFSCLRRKEGFELPAVEALLCGTWPILFDTPDYRRWFDDMAIFIPECGVAETVAHLKKVFRRKPKPVSDWGMEQVKARFDWKRSVSGFWDRCMT